MNNNEERLDPSPEYYINTWKRWMEEATDKYLASLKISYTHPYRLCIRSFGLDHTHICGECANLTKREHHDATYFKCRQTTPTHGSGSDWRYSWSACGRFREKAK